MPDTSISIADFARNTLGKPLYPYQCEIAEAILASIHGNYGHIFTVMMARQSGKNQISAVIEAYLLTTRSRGTIVKAAPTFIPQIMHSRLRLLSLLDHTDMCQRVWHYSNNIIGLAPTDNLQARRNHLGPRVMFFSASPDSNVVGATADLLLEIDEAQDVSVEKFDRDFRPMVAITNATTVLYGTAWSDVTLLAQQRAHNLAWQERTGQRRHFEYDWRVQAAINPSYRSFVEQEIARLGKEHIAIQTQYFLRPNAGATYFFTPLQQSLLQGTHRWEETPLSDAYYIASIDVAGDQHLSVAAASPQRDSTIITIGRVRYNEFHHPVIEVVHHEKWTGLPYLEQYTATVALVEQWHIRTLVIDATGQGAGLSSLLLTRLSADRVMPFIFTRPSKSQLAYQLQAFINSGRLKIYTLNAAPRTIFDECWHQIRITRYRLPAAGTLDIYVDPAEGHDDFLISLALLPNALASLFPTPLSSIVRPTYSYVDNKRF